MRQKVGSEHQLALSQMISHAESASEIKKNHLFITALFIVQFWIYSKTCVRQPPLKLTLVVDVERWLSYKGTCHVILM